MTMLAEYGKLSLAEVLAPAIQMADGYPIEAQTANSIEINKKWIKQWKYSPAIFLTHQGEAREAPEPGEIFVQKDLAATLRKLVDAEQSALKSGKNRKEAIYAAYDRFYKGDIADELVRGVQEDGGLITKADLAAWKVRIEEPVNTTYKGITVYKLPFWQQGPAMLQALNILENADLKAMGYNSPKYMHTIYQAMNLAFADRDFYYGDPYAFEGGANPFATLLAKWTVTPAVAGAPLSGQQDKPASPDSGASQNSSSDSAFKEAFYSGTTSIEAADEEGWVVSVTPSGGWVPAVIAGHTGVGLSQRAQSFVTDAADGPFNVIEPGKHPRVTLTPTMALKDGAPYLSFAVQGGDSQDQNLLQFFLNVVEFGMTVQQAVEAPNINSFQMRSSFGLHESRPGHMLVSSSIPVAVREELTRMGYTLEFEKVSPERTSGPINAIMFDRKHGSMWGGSSNHGEDYGIAW
jgi:gamma-glutamyltranspeptidase/glutathione hydrolase